MRWILLCFLLLPVFHTAFSQYHFIYIQAENKKPFFVTLNNRSYASTAAGYVIIPKLTDTMYRFTVRFENEPTEERFQCFINKKDLGFNLKNIGNKGWSLQNLQSYAIIMSSSSELAGSITDKPEPTVTEQKKTKSLQTKTVVPNENRVTKFSEALKKLKTSLQNKKATANKAQVIKATEFVDDKGLNQLYIDILAKGTMDTIDVFIPYVSNPQAKPVNVKDSIKPAGKAKNQKANADTLKKRFNVNCTYQASGADFFNIRRRMAAATSEDKMIEEAKKTFKTRCFTTQQIKNLSVLFLTDEGKYKFFDAIYPVVYDSWQFETLENELSDPYYRNRFKAMLRY